MSSNSCTVNIFRYANVAGRQDGFDVRHLLNGLADRYLYAAGLVDTTLPFAELRRRSEITRAGMAAEDAPDFSTRIRAGLPRAQPHPLHRFPPVPPRRSQFPRASSVFQSFTRRLYGI
jgi:hypothetical protein